MTTMRRSRAGRLCRMADLTAIPALYLHEKKAAAGIAGIRSNPDAREEYDRARCAHIRAYAIKGSGSYPRYPRNINAFNELNCGDRGCQRVGEQGKNTRLQDRFKRPR